MSFNCNDKVKIKDMYWKGYVGTIIDKQGEYFIVQLDDSNKHLKFTDSYLDKPDADIKKYQECGKIVV
jgi:ribosomal protein L21E